MSMLSAQCDELRELAGDGSMEFVSGPIRASVLREAADTIWELRNRCADFVDERERLFSSNVEKNGEVLRLVSENAKLRKLVKLWSVINKHMGLCATTDCGQCPVREECGESVYLEGLLGIDPKELSWRVQERMAKTTDVQVENKKLRELVADMWPFLEGAMDDEYCPAPECPFTELCTENQACMASSGFHYRMRELGIEVNV